MRESRKASGRPQPEVPTHDVLVPPTPRPTRRDGSDHSCCSNMRYRQCLSRGRCSGGGGGADGRAGLPADFPIAPGLSACHPIVTGPEVICDWKGVDGHAVYMFYHDALPKAGYTLLPGAGEQTSPSEMGAIGFKKGSVSGAITVRGTSVTIQVLTCPTAKSCA